jgi:hypothetical protein
LCIVHGGRLLEAERIRKGREEERERVRTGSVTVRASKTREELSLTLTRA